MRNALPRTPRYIRQLISTRFWLMIVVLLSLGAISSACSSPNPQPPGLTPIPTLAPGTTPTLIAALQAPPGGTSAPAPSAAGDPALGVPIFLQNCSPCHGIDGQGVDAPALRNSQFVQSGDQAVFQTIANGRPGTAMPAWLQANGGPLPETQISDVVAYLHTLQNVPPLPRATPLPPEPTATPLPPNAPTAEPARPSNPGGPGAAVNLTGDPTRGRALFGEYCAVCHGPEGVQGKPNPDSDDGTVPTLNPIDPSIANPDPKVFAANIDLFIEHGSVPSGPSPLLEMPAFGDGKMLAPQQIADLIGYLMQLNHK